MGSELARRWDPENFDEVAHDVLREISPPPDLSFTSLTDWALARNELPNQVNFHSGFGSPPIVVYADEENRFYAEILVWFPSRTAIHGHGFSGAFRVLEGYSIQCRYKYEGEELCEGVRRGSLKPVGLDFVSPGHTNAITKDENFIHTVVHMGMPSLTLVVRNHSDESTRHQYEYFRNGLAISSFLRSQSQSRQVEMLRAFRAVHPEKFKEKAIEYLVGEDLHRFGLGLLSTMAPELKADSEFLGEVRRLATKKFGEDVELLFAAFDESARGDVLWSLIRQNARPDLQMLTSLRELIPDEKELQTLLRLNDPERAPKDILADWEKHTREAVESQ